MATPPARTISSDGDRQYALASDVDAQREMEQAEFFLTTIMDARAAQDAFDLDDCPLTDASSADASPSAAATPHDSKHACADNALPSYRTDAIVSQSPLDVSCFDDSTRGDATVAPAAVETEETNASRAVSADALAPLELALLESADRPVQWNLISPWSESDEADDSDDGDDNERDERVHVDTRAFFRHDSSSSTLYTINEPEPEEESERNRDDLEDNDDDDASTLQIEAQLRALIKSESIDSTAARHVDVDADGVRTWTLHAGDADDDDDEEFEVFNAAHALVQSATAGNEDEEELVDEKLTSSAASDHDQDDEYGTDGTRTSVATTLDDSCGESPRPSASGTSRFLGRRAQTYSGAASASMQTAFAKLRSRTLSTASSFRHASSSSQRSSRTSTSDVDESSASGTGEYDSSVFDLDASGRRGSSVSSRPTLTSRLGSVSSLRMSGSKMSGFLRFRSSSATTAASDESDCLDAMDTLSAPSLSSIDVASALRHQSEQQSPHQSHHVQMHALKLKASAAASKAAGYLNAASVEAARKLKSRTTRSAVGSSAKTSCEHESESHESGA